MPLTTKHPEQALTCPAASVEDACGEEVVVENPNVILPPSLRAIRLTDEQAEEIRRVLDEPNESIHAGCEMPTADASILKNRR